MNDPQPTGYITVFRAFEAYNDTWPEPDTLADKQRLTDENVANFKYAFEHQQLDARVVFPDRPGEFDVPPELWSVEGFPELHILHRDVPRHAPKEWAPYVGHTLFVRESTFHQWLKHNGWQPPPDPNDFDDPSKLATWTMPMVCAWIGARTIDAVRWQMCAWRRAHGWPDASLALLAVAQQVTVSDDNDDDDPSFFDSRKTWTEFVHAAESGEITVMGLSSVSGEPAQLQPSDWTYGKLEFDDGLRERWRVGRTLFSNMMCRRVDVQRKWPMDETPDAEQSSSSGAPGRPSSMHLIEAEFARRATLQPKEVDPTVKQQSETLRSWFVNRYPALKRPTAKTIENRIRSAYRRTRN